MSISKWVHVFYLCSVIKILPRVAGERDRLWCTDLGYCSGTGELPLIPLQTGSYRFVPVSELGTAWWPSLDLQSWLDLLTLRSPPRFLSHSFLATVCFPDLPTRHFHHHSNFCLVPRTACTALPCYTAHPIVPSRFTYTGCWTCGLHREGACKQCKLIQRSHLPCAHLQCFPPPLNHDALAKPITNSLYRSRSIVPEFTHYLCTPNIKTIQSQLQRMQVTKSCC